MSNSPVEDGRLDRELMLVVSALLGLWVGLPLVARRTRDVS